MNKEIICVNCPKGCRIKVVLENNNIQSITGYSCENGKIYAQEEFLCPMRVLTTTVRIDQAYVRVLPVITDGPIPLEKMDEAMKEIKKIRVCAPIHMNDILVSHFLGTNVNLIASRDMEKFE